jgi:hypothetical protein
VVSHTLLRTETKLQQMQDDWNVREMELKQEVETLRAAKRDSEARLAGVDLAQMEAENTAVLQMQKELARAQSQHAEVVQRLESRLQWCARVSTPSLSTSWAVVIMTHSPLAARYAENQELVANGTLCQHEQMVSLLEARIVELEEELASHRDGTEPKRYPSSIVDVQNQLTHNQRFGQYAADLRVVHVSSEGPTPSPPQSGTYRLPVFANLKNRCESRRGSDSASERGRFESHLKRPDWWVGAATDR